MKYAGFWNRIAAFVIDVTIFIILFGGVDFLLLLTGNHKIEDLIKAQKLLMKIYLWLYFTLSESSPWQATIGKQAMGLKVTDEGGNKIGFGRANARHWTKILSVIIFFIGVFMIIFDEKKQALHDKIAGTLVFKKTEST